jgi:poly(A) polymerase
MKFSLNKKIFRMIAEAAREENKECYVVGGYVRDLILKRPSKDIDVVVVGSGIDIAKKVASKIGKTKVTVFKSFGTAMLRYRDIEVEFVGARKESYQRNSRKPIVENGTLKDDQLRRDFTINALAISLNSDNYGEVVDPFNGLQHIEEKKIITPQEPAATFSDDPLRMIRAIRFAAQLNFRIEENTLEGIKQSAHRLKIISRERITDELNKILLSAKPSIGFFLLSKTGLLPEFFPELEALKGVEVRNKMQHKDNFIHTLRVLDNLAEKSDNLWLRWAALLHDIAKPRTKRFSPQHGWTFHGHDHLGSKMIPEIFKKLKLPLNDKMKYVQKLVLLHLRPIVLSQEEVTDSAVRRLIFDAGDDIDDLMLLCECDITSKNETRVKRFLQNFEIVRQKIEEIEAKDKVRNFQPPIDGNLIIKTFELKPGREIGIIKNAIKDAILDGIISNDFEEAYNFMIKKGKELGLKPVKNDNKPG